MRKLLILILFFPGLSWCQSDTISLFNWNVFLRPRILKDKQLERVPLIAEFILLNNCDIIVLQEVFDRRARRVLIDSLDAIYPFYTSIGKKTIWGVSSGVLIASKTPLLNERSLSFKKGTGSDKMAKKGVVFVETVINNDTLTIAGTHLQAGQTKKRATIGKSQLAQFSSAFKDLNFSTGILAGDFNTIHGTTDYKEMLLVLNVEHKMLDSQFQFTANFEENELYPSIGSPEWIDFIFLRGRSTSQYLDLVVVPHSNNGKYISDHEPLIGRFIQANN